MLSVRNYNHRRFKEYNAGHSANAKESERGVSLAGQNTLVNFYSFMNSDNSGWAVNCQVQSFVYFVHLYILTKDDT